MAEGLRGIANASAATWDRAEPTGPLLRVADNPLLLTTPKKRNGFDTEAADQAACSEWAVEASLRSPPLLNQVRARGLGRLAGKRPLLPVGLDEPGVAGRAASKLRAVVGKGSGVVGRFPFRQLGRLV